MPHTRDGLGIVEYQIRSTKGEHLTGAHPGEDGEHVEGLEAIPFGCFEEVQEGRRGHGDVVRGT